MKANFKQLRVEVAFDEFKELDVARELGNYIHANTADIGVDDVAREIYHSSGEVEVRPEQAQAIMDIINHPNCMLLAAVKKAIINELSKD